MDGRSLPDTAWRATYDQEHMTSRDNPIQRDHDSPVAVGQSSGCMTTLVS